MATKKLGRRFPEKSFLGNQERSRTVREAGHVAIARREERRHTLLDYLEGGDTLDEFLDAFPTVNREQIISLLELIKDKLPCLPDAYSP